MEMGLLEMGKQLMTVPKISFPTMNAISYWCYENSSQYQTGETDDSGWKLLEFALSHRLTPANALHSHKLSRTATWHTPNKQVHN